MPSSDWEWITDDIRRVQTEHMKWLDALYSGRAPERVFSICGRMFGRSHGLAGVNEIDMLQAPERWLDDVIADMRANAHEAADPVNFRPLSIELDPLGVHFIDALLGASVYFHDGQVWSDQLECDPEQVVMPDLADSELMRSAVRLAELAAECALGAVAEGRQFVFVSTPVLSCTMNIGVNLFGQRLLEAMTERQEAAKKALRIINDVILECIRAFARAMPDAVRRNSVVCTRYAPAGYGQIDGCATQLVSAEHYAEFFAPLDEELLEASPQGGMIHLCGRHEQHIPVWRAMKAARSVQINDRAADDFELYFNGLRPDQIIYVGPTAQMTVERIVDISGGRRVVLQCWLDKPLPV